MFAHNISQSNSGQQEKIHNRLAVLRAERKISREELAEKLGVNRQTIGSLERGDHTPNLRLAMSIASYFQVPIESIFSWQEFTPELGMASK